MSLRGRFFALTYDRMSAKIERAGLRAHREELLAGASGQVLEIGAGTGANLGLYGSELESLTVTEPEAPMLKWLECHVQERLPLTTVVRAPAEDLPFADGTFDTAVSTLVLCGVDDQERALRELRRVLRPGGKLLFIEHVRSDEASLARKQDRMNGLNHFLVGCDCNRTTLDSIQAAGFGVIRLERTTLDEAPSFVSPLI